MLYTKPNGSPFPHRDCKCRQRLTKYDYLTIGPDAEICVECKDKEDTMSHGISALIRTREHRRLMKYRIKRLSIVTGADVRGRQCLKCLSTFVVPRMLRWTLCEVCRARELIENHRRTP